MTTAAELRAAAEDARMKFSPDCSVDSVCAHILATVHADDDEPVTEEWYRSEGFQDRHCDNSIELENTVIVDLWGLDVTVCNAKPRIKTRGQMRRLLAALGVESRK